MSKQIPLTKGKVALVDDFDFEFLSQWKWCLCHGTYAKRAEQSSGKHQTIYMHRVILGLRDKTQVDHIDGNGLNNQRRNLRVATQAQNCSNRKIQSNNTTGFKGVCWDKSRGKWIAYIVVGRRFKNLGRFSNPTEAAARYDKAAAEFFGAYALTNHALQAI